MNPIFDFLINPYLNYSSLDIVLEVLAVMLGLISVWFAKNNNIAVYPTGMFSTSIFVYILLKANLLGDMIINVYFFLMSIYGWYFWVQKEGGQVLNKIAKINKKELKWGLLLFMGTIFFVIGFYRFLRDGMIPLPLLILLQQHYFLWRCGLWQDEKLSTGFYG